MLRMIDCRHCRFDGGLHFEAMKSSSSWSSLSPTSESSKGTRWQRLETTVKNLVGQFTPKFVSITAGDIIPTFFSLDTTTRPQVVLREDSMYLTVVVVLCRLNSKMHDNPNYDALQSKFSHAARTIELGGSMQLQRAQASSAPRQPWQNGATTSGALREATKRSRVRVPVIHNLTRKPSIPRRHIQTKRTMVATPNHPTMVVAFSQRKG